MKKDYYRRYFMFYIALIFCMGAVISCNSGIDDISKADPSASVTHVANGENSAKLSLGAKIVYMKYFTMSSSYSISYDTIPDSMAGKDLSSLSGSFPGWEVIYLDSGKVILEQKIDSYGPQTYIIGTVMKDDDEFVCVYEYDDVGEKMLHSVFDTPVMLFDEVTSEELRKGIVVFGEDALYNALEEYGE